MATKHNSKCLQNADDNEPIFVLRAQDRLAPNAVRKWAETALIYGLSREKYEEAMKTADDMDR